MRRCSRLAGSGKEISPVLRLGGLWLYRTPSKIRDYRCRPHPRLDHSNPEECRCCRQSAIGKHPFGRSIPCASQHLRLLLICAFMDHFVRYNRNLEAGSSNLSGRARLLLDPSLNSGFACGLPLGSASLTPARRLKFESLRAHRIFLADSFLVPPAASHSATLPTLI
jgi:hypothetical protein